LFGAAGGWFGLHREWRSCGKARSAREG
jgi:hypothetical protein